MHKRMLDDVYNYIKFYSCIFEASIHFKCVKSRSRYKPIAGWNDHCQDLYRKCREIFLPWSNNGRIRYGDLFGTMKRSRKDFKNALDYCKNNEMKLKKEKMLASFAKNNKINFWKCCNSLKNKPTDIVAIIDGCSDPFEIINIFNRKFGSILDDPECQVVPTGYREKLEYLGNRNEGVIGRIFLADVDRAITRLSTSLGHDFIHSKHIEYMPKNLKNY